MDKEENTLHSTPDKNRPRVISGATETLKNETAIAQLGYNDSLLLVLSPEKDKTRAVLQWRRNPQSETRYTPALLYTDHGTKWQLFQPTPDEEGRYVVTIGRSSDADANRIIEPSVSNEHATLKIDGDVVEVSDHSSHGTNAKIERNNPDLPPRLLGKEWEQVLSGEPLQNMLPVGERILFRLGKVADRTLALTYDSNMNTVITYKDSDGQEKVLKIDENEDITIGRTRDNDIVIDDKGVSRKHMTLRLEGQNITVRDEHTTNGTYVRSAIETEKTIDEENSGLLSRLRKWREK